MLRSASNKDRAASCEPGLGSTQLSAEMQLPIALRMQDELTENVTIPDKLGNMVFPRFKRWKLLSVTSLRGKNNGVNLHATLFGEDVADLVCKLVTHLLSARSL